MREAHVRPLAPEVAERIAAGEVIERPASVVKELLENGLDAGASRVTVEIERGGRELIRVSDDGEGAWWEDGEFLFQRHATSKIRLETELEALGTLGFRGEALASMGAVAEVEFASRRREEETGLRLLVVGGAREVRERTSRAPGTTVTVRRLFYNVPARRSFVRAEREEGIEVTRVVTRYALAYPGVAFELRRDGRPVLRLGAEAEAAHRWGAIWGREEAARLLPVAWANDELRVGGAVGDPEHTRGTATDIILFVNGRLVSDRALTGTILSAYRGLLTPRRFPRALLHLEMDPAGVDVNVHPAKREVRFRSPDRVRSAARRAVANALAGYLDPHARPLAPRGEKSSTSGGVIRESILPFSVREGDRPAPAGRPSAAAATRASAIPDIFPARSDEHAPRVARDGLPVQIDRTFILDLGEDGVVLYDQHSAHERVLFEEALARLASRRGEAQELLIPATIELTPEEEEALETMGEALAALGYRIEPFGPRAVAVGAYPTCLGRWDGGEALRRMLSGRDADGEHGHDAYGRSAEGATDLSDASHRVAATFACKNAIKAGQTLTRREMTELVERLRHTGTPHLCPHGRPTVVRVSLAEVRRRFRRE